MNLMDLFYTLVGDISGCDPDLIFILACVFGLFVVTEFCRFIELTIDFVFRRKKKARTIR